MKFASATFLAVATAASPVLTYGASNTFENMLDLIGSLNSEADTLNVLYMSKEDELAYLQESCDTNSSGANSKPNSRPASSTTSTHTGEGVPEETPGSSVGTTSLSLSSSAKSTSSTGSVDPNHEPKRETTSSSGKSTMPQDSKGSSSYDDDSSSSETEAGSGDSPSDRPTGGGGKWTPKIGNTWNYNLATPVDTNAGVDVFFIDMGECVGKYTLCY